MATKKHPIWGKMDSETPPPSWHKGLYYFGGVFFLLVGCGCLFSSCSLSKTNDIDTFSMLFMWALGIGGIVGGIFSIIAPKKEMEAWESFHAEIEEEKRKEAEKIEKQQEEYKKGNWTFPTSFITKCKKNGIDDLASERNYQKAKLIADGIMEKAGIPTQYRAQYVTKEALEKEFARAEELDLQKKIKETRKKEAELAKTNKEYTSYIGVDKSVAYCNAQITIQKKIITRCNANENSVLSGGETIYRSSKGKESSWAIHGGIASGIAGPVAGIAVAADVERRNQEIRNRNNQLADTIIQMQSISLNNIYQTKAQAEEELKYWTNKLEDVKIKLIGDIKGKALLEKMSPKIVSLEKSITDNVLVDVRLIPPNNLTIYDGVRAVVDGSFKVEIYADNEKVGSAVCALPFEGLTYDKTFKVVCSNISKTSDHYTAKVLPHHLWATEE